MNQECPRWLGTVTVEPGDVLVIVLHPDTTRQTLDTIVAQQHEHRPDLKDRVMFVVGATGLAVLKAEQEAAPDA